MKLRYNRRATERYTAVLIYLTEQNSAAALRSFNKAEAALARLQRFPTLGPYTRAGAVTTPRALQIT